jgi:hypothetical protein
MLLNKFFDVERFAVPAFSFGIAVANFFYAKTGSTEGMRWSFIRGMN